MPKDNRRVRLLASFRSSVVERISRLHQGVETLENTPAHPNAPEQIMREIHTVKGEAKIMGFDFICSVAHVTENLLVEASEQGFRINSDAWVDIVSGLDYISALAQNPGQPGSALVAAAEAFMAAQQSSNSDSDSPAGPPSAIAAQSSLGGPRAGDLGEQTFEADDDETKTPLASNHSERHAAPTGNVTDNFVHVSSRHLATLTTLCGDLVVHHEQMDRLLLDVGRIMTDMGRTLDGLRHNNLEGQTARRSRLHALAREMRATVTSASDESFDNHLALKALQEQIRKLRLQRINGVLEEQARGARNLARELDKRVRIRTAGGDVVADKQVLDHLQEPIMHILRNAIDHGIETVPERLAAGKDIDAKVQLEAHQAGGHVEVIISDDGRGIDPEEVRKQVIERGMLDRASAQVLGAEELLQFVFRSGFSTRAAITEVSGRGVGLDVVHAKLDDLGGEVRLESRAGHGTRFVLRAPVNVALAKALVVRAAGMYLALPSTTVTRTLHIEQGSIGSSANMRYIMFDDERVPLVSLALIVSGTGPSPAALRSVVVLCHAGQLLAVEVDELEGERETVRKALDPFIADLELINGTAVIEGGRLVLFLHLAAVYRHASSIKRQVWTAKSSEQRPRLLVVDDSELTRDMLVSILGRSGFAVYEAVDGLDALKLLESHRVDLVLTDLDMPALDGFGLVRQLRQQPSTKTLPVIVFSTRGSSKDKEQAMAAGANAYLVKAAFREANFVETLRLYLGGR